MSAVAVVTVADGGRTTLHVERAGQRMTEVRDVQFPDGNVSASAVFAAELAKDGWAPVAGSDWEMTVGGTAVDVWERPVAEVTS